MKIKKTIEIKIEKKGGNFYCPSNREVSFLLGTTSATSNPHVYKIQKKNRMWVIPVQMVKDRKKELQIRLESLQEKLGIIKQVLK